MLLITVALAGSLELHDDADVLDPTEEESLTRTLRALPFDAYVLTTDAEPDEPALQARVRAARTRSKQLVVGVSPKLRRTEVEVGAGLGLSRTEIDEVARAGDTAFKAGSWASGIASIVDRAGRPSPVAAPAPPAPEPRTLDLSKDDPSIPILAVIGAMLAAGTAIALFVLRRTSRRLRDAEHKLPD